MAVCLESNSSYKIVSQHEQKREKSLFLVKLTDSCLKSIEQLQNPTVKVKLAKNGSTRTPSIHFSNGGKCGTLSIPSKNDTDNSVTKFNFSCSSLFTVNSTIGLDCLQQNKGDASLTLLGNITEKITVSANNDSYETTKTRMAEVEKERKGNSAKVIELAKNGSTGTKKTKRMPNLRQKINFRKVNNKISSTSSSSLKGLREKVIHLLALRPCNKLELRLKLERDGVKLKDAVVLTNILQQVSSMQDNVFVLNRHLYTEVQVDTWPGYTDEDRQTIKTKLVSEMGCSVDRLSPGPFATSLVGNHSAKRPLPGAKRPGVNPAGKKPRIAHTTHNNTSKSDTKRPSTDKSPPKLTSQPPRNIPARRASREDSKTNHKTMNKKTPSKDTTTSNGSEMTSNDSNNNNFSFSKTEPSTNEDYLIKYPEIKTYEQRCSYKEDFAKEYVEFNATKERLDLVSKQFNVLKEKLTKYPEDSHAAKELQEEIFKVYEEKKEGWSKDRQRLNYLYPKLNHIKNLVIQYDQTHFGTS